MTVPHHPRSRRLDAELSTNLATRRPRCETVESRADAFHRGSAISFVESFLGGTQCVAVWFGATLSLPEPILSIGHGGRGLLDRLAQGAPTPDRSASCLSFPPAQDPLGGTQVRSRGLDGRMSWFGEPSGVLPVSGGEHHG